MSDRLPDQTQPNPTEARETELWQVLDWSLWGNGLADVLRFPMADVMVAALSEEQREQAEACIKAWHERRGPSMAVGEGTELQRQRDTYKAAFEHLAEAVRGCSTTSTFGLLSRLQVAEEAVRRGPQVITYAEAGKCWECGNRPPEDGYFVCDWCLQRQAASDV